MTAIDRHEIHQVLCMGLAHSAQYGQYGGLLRLLRTLPANGTRVRVAQWLERFSPYRVHCDQNQDPVSLIAEPGRGFDPESAASTPYWRFPGPNPILTGE